MSDVLLQADLVTPRLRLRRLRLSDAPLLALYGADPRVARMTTGMPSPYPPGLAEAYIERILSPTARETVWAIDSGADEENGLIGLISLKTLPEDERELSYWIAPAFWGAGYASEAVEAVVAQADAHRFPVLIARVFQDNEPAAKALTRARFNYLGTGEAHSVARGAMVPTFRYRRELGA